MPAQHNLYLSAIRVKNPNTFFVLLYLACIPETGNPTHQSELQKGIWYRKTHLSSPESDSFHLENVPLDMFPQNLKSDNF